MYRIHLHVYMYMDMDSLEALMIKYNWIKEDTHYIIIIYACIRSVIDYSQ